MAHPQNSPRGLFAKVRIDIGAQQMTANSTALLLSGGARLSAQANAIMTGDSTGVVLNAGLKVSNKANAVMTGNATAVVFNGGVKISNAQTITANSTAYIFTSESALPGNVALTGAGLAMIQDSTGRVALAINSSGTTWKYLNVTTKIPT